MRKKIAIGLGVVLLLPWVALALALITLQWPPVRDVARDQLLGLLQGVIAGKLTVDDVRWPSLGRVELSGVRLEDRHGQRVASIAALSARLRLAPLLSGTVHLDEVTAHGVFADLGTPGVDRGLLSVFDSESTAEPDSAAGGFSPVQVRIDRLCLEGSEIGIQAGVEARFALHRFDACVNLRIADTIEVGLDRLWGQLVYNRAQTLTWVDEKALRSATASGAAARGFLRGKVHIKSDAVGFDGRVEIRAVSPSTLNALNLNIKGLRENVDASASVSGDATRMRYRVELRAADSCVRARGEFRPRHAVTAEISSDDLQLARLTGLEVEPLSFVLEVQADLSRPAGPRLRVKLPRGSYGAWALPVSEAQAEFAEGGAVTLSSFEARYPAGSVVGDAHISGRGAITAKARFSVAALERLPPLQNVLPGWAGALSADATLQRAADGGGLSLAANVSLKRVRSKSPTFTVQEIDARISATGSPRRPNLNAVVAAKEVRAAGQHFAALGLTAQGGPDIYRVHGHLDGDRAILDAWLRPAGDGLTAGGRVVAHLPRGLLQARVKRVRVASGRALQIDALRVTHLGTRVSADGHFGLSHRPSQLRILAEVSDISVLTEEFAGTKVPGHLRAVAKMRGPLDKPRIELQAALHNGPRFAGSPSSLALFARLDAPGGKAEVRAKASAGKAAAAATLDSSWRPHAPLSTVIETAQHELNVHLDSVSLADLVRQSDLTLPIAVSGTVTGALRAVGTRKSLGVQGEVNARVRVGKEPDVAVNLRANYDDSALGINAELTDKYGRLLTANWHQTTRIERLVEKSPTLAEWMGQTAWEASVKLASRRITELPVLPTLQSERPLWPLRAEFSAKLAHQPGREPTGEVRAVTTWDPLPVAAEWATCSNRVNPTVKLVGTLRDGLFVVEVHGSEANARAFTLRADVGSLLEEWLAGKTPRLNRVKLAAEVERLELARWPVACEHAAGTLTGKFSASDLFDKRAQFAARLDGKHITVDESLPFDLNARVTATAGGLDVFARLEERLGGNATVRGSVPILLQASDPATSIHWDGGLALDVALSRVDVKSILALVPVVARPSGTLDGRLHVTGTLGAPRGAGSIGLHDVSFTLPQLGQRFTKINGSVGVIGNRVRIPELTVRDQGGSAKLIAELVMDSLDAWTANLNMKFDDFPVRKQGVLIGRADGVAKVKLFTSHHQSDIEIRLRNVSINLTGDTGAQVQSLDEHSEIAVTGETLQAAGQQRQDARAKIVNVYIRLDEPLWVRRDDFAIRVRADLAVHVADGVSQISGEVKLERGFIDLLGQQFDVKRGRVLFTGGQQVNPRLELTATAAAPSGKQVRVEVTGLVSAPMLAFFVDDDAVTAGQALAVLTGRYSPDSSKEQSAQDQVASVAMGLTTGLLSLGARREFGGFVPILSVQQGDGGTRVRAGIDADRLIPKFARGFVQGVYVEGVVSTGQEGARGNAGGGVLLELMLPWDLVWAGQYGPGQTWSLDLDWRP